MFSRREGYMSVARIELLTSSTIMISLPSEVVSLSFEPMRGRATAIISNAIAIAANIALMMGREVLASGLNILSVLMLPIFSNALRRQRIYNKKPKAITGNSNSK